MHVVRFSKTPENNTNR